jgi:hypothetical protein
MPPPIPATGSIHALASTTNPRLGRQLYRIRPVSDRHIILTSLHRQQGCTVLQRGIHGRFVGTAMSKAVDTHHRKNCSFCISSPPLASAPQRCRPSTPRSRSTCTIVNSREQQRGPGPAINTRPLRILLRQIGTVRLPSSACDR